MRLIVIDPYVSLRTPSMRSWVTAFPAFRDLFDEIEVWSSECSLPLGDGISWKPVSRPYRIYAFHALDFQWKATRLMKSHVADPDTIVFVTGCNVPKADIRYVHFWNRAMLEESAKRPADFLLKPHQKLLAWIVGLAEKRVTKGSDTTRWWWVVSRSIAERIRSENAPGSFRILANPYDAERFNFSVREATRSEMRAHYGFSATEAVLVFSSFGHFERKGLLQAAQAIDLLVKGGNSAKLLILGGTPATIASFKKRALEQHIDLSSCVFAGLVDQIEKHLSAADGLLFPSHFEAFSLAEIEAAALGLRLYLTPHYGSEMILREPVNGRFLPWDPEGMARVLREEIEQGALGTFHLEKGDAITSDEFASSIRTLFEEVIADKQQSRAGSGGR